MIQQIDPVDPAVATEIVRIQRAAYALEAELMGFDGIPPLHETVDQVAALSDLYWLGAFDGEQLVAIIAWDLDDDVLDIDRLAVDPQFARRGLGRRLVQAVPTIATSIVSTGTKNHPARDLYVSEGFSEIGQTEIAPNIFTTQFHRPANFNA